MTDNELIEIAAKAKKRAYSPYSNFKVGAALLTSGGKIYTGCNIENAAYGECMCAERVALFKAISEGERDFVALAVVGGEDICPPCGSCRQALSEFCSPNLPVLLFDGKKAVKFTLGELLPKSFKLKVTK